MIQNMIYNFPMGFMAHTTFKRKIKILLFVSNWQTGPWNLF